MENFWSDALRHKISDLELIASWASQVGFGIVRDHVRKAIYELTMELARYEEVNKKAASTLEREDG